MTTTEKKIRDAGWFYHAPARRRNAEPVLVPPTSQIPGLNYPLDDVLDEPVRPLFRDTDTKYIRLAKQGGRQNLLQFKENPNMSEKPIVGYPRSEWYYLEDNAIEDAEAEEEQKKYEFRVPEYMAHDVHQPSKDDNYLGAGRTPYAHDRLSAYDREGKSLKDKTLKLPEVKRSGYGVRIAKPAKTKSHPQERTRPSEAAKISQIERDRPHLKYLPLPEEEKAKARMSKLLSFAYDREWQDRINKWQTQQDKVRDKHRTMMAADTFDKEPIDTEYRTTIGKQIGNPHRRTEKVKKTETSHSAGPNTENQLAVNFPGEKHSRREKELFKLSKFKNIPSKVDSHNTVKAAEIPVVKPTDISAVKSQDVPVVVAN